MKLRFLGKIGGDYMVKPKENGFIIETYDNEAIR